MLQKYFIGGLLLALTACETAQKTDELTMIVGTYTNAGYSKAIGGNQNGQPLLPHPLCQPTGDVCGK